MKMHYTTLHYTTLHYTNKIPLVLLLLTLSFTSLAQPLYTILENPSSLLSNEETIVLNKVISYPFIEQHWVIQSDKLETVQNDGLVQIIDPLSANSITFQASTVEYSNENNYAWGGVRLDNDSLIQSDYLMLTKTNEHLSGSIALGSDFYRIFPLSPNYQVLARVSGIGDNTHGEETSSMPETQECTPTEDGCNIRVMVVFHESLQNSHPNIAFEAHHLIAETNMAMGRSRINHRYELVSVTKLLDNLSTSFKIEEQLDFLVTNILASQSFTTDLRNNVKADVVILLTKSTDINNLVNGATPTQLNFTQLEIDELASAVDIDAALSASRTLTHELGHMLGAGHEETASRIRPIPARAHEINPFFGPNRITMVRTIVNHDPSQYILVYSNPDVPFSWWDDMGTDEHNNACVMQSNGCYVAQALQPPVDCDFSANVQVDYDENCVPINISASVSDIGSGCASSTFYYTFSTSTNGINFTDNCSDSPIPSCDFPPPLLSPVQNTFFLKITIKRLINGQFETFEVIFRPVTFGNCGKTTGSGGGGVDKTSTTQLPTSATTWTVAPNPLRSIFSLSGAEWERVEIVDQYGRKVYASDSYLPDFQVNMDGFSKGTYWLRIYGTNQLETIKLLKQ